MSKQNKTVLNNSDEYHDRVGGVEPVIVGKGSGKRDFSRGGEQPDVFSEGVENGGVLKVSKFRTLLTLCMIHQHPRILLGMKKRGFGKGKWNGFGGHVEKGETIEEAARREIREEAGLEVGEIKKHGIIDFEFKDNPEILEVHIFRATEFTGEPVESDEMKPQWYHVDEVAALAMWEDDKYWLPLLLDEKNFKAKFWFDEGDKILKYDLKEISEL